MAKSVLPMLSSRNFIASDRIFRSLIHFEFIFVYGVRKCSNFIFLHVAVQFFQHHSLRRLSFSTVYSCLLCNGLIIREWVYLWWLDGRESQWTPGVGDGQGGLVCCDSWGRKESDTTERPIWSDLILLHWSLFLFSANTILFWLL